MELNRSSRKQQETNWKKQETESGTLRAQKKTTIIKAIQIVENAF